MSAVRRLLVLPILLGAVVAFSALAAAPAPAQANSCQVERTLGVNHPVSESQDPRCIVLKAVGCDNLADPSGCVGGIRTFVLGTAVNVVCKYSTAICFINP